MTPITGHLLRVELARVELAAETLQESLVAVTVSPETKWSHAESNCDFDDAVVMSFR